MFAEKGVGRAERFLVTATWALSWAPICCPQTELPLDVGPLPCGEE